MGRRAGEVGGGHCEGDGTGRGYLGWRVGGGREGGRDEGCRQWERKMEREGGRERLHIARIKFNCMCSLLP